MKVSWQMPAKMSDKRIVFCGCIQIGQRTLQALLGAGHKISSIVTLPPEQVARANVSDYCDLREIAVANGIPYFVPETYALSSARDIAYFEQNAFDLLIMGGNVFSPTTFCKL